MDTEPTHDQQSAPRSTTARPDEELGGHDLPATFEQPLKPSLEDRATSADDAAADAALLAQQFAGIVYFSDMAADRSRQPQPPHRNVAGSASSASGAESACSARGRRPPTRPWRLPAGDRSPKS